MEKTRDLFKRIRDTRGTFHAKMGTIKNRNGMDPTEAEDIKKGWQEYTELYFGSKITADGDCSHEIKTLTPWQESYDQPRQHIKKLKFV